MTSDLSSAESASITPPAPLAWDRLNSFREKWGRVLTVAVLFIVILLSLDFRIQAVNGTVVDQPLRADAGQYFLYAYNLRHHGVYSRDQSALYDPEATLEPDALRTPGYPLFVAAFLKEKDALPALNRIKHAQAALSVLVVLLIYLTARRFLPTQAALAAALLTALSPHLVNANVYVLTESLFAFCLALLFWVLAVYADSRRQWILFFVGVLIGAGALVRPSLQYFAVPLALLVAYYADSGTRVKAVALIVLGFALVFSPWVGRNLLTPDLKHDPGLAVGTLHHGMYPNLKYQDDDRSFGYPYRADPNADAIGESMASVLAEIRRRFSEEPGRHLHWYLIGKPVKLWSWDIVQGMGNGFIYPVKESPYFEAGFMDKSHWLMRDLHWPLVLLAALGALAVWLPASAQGLDQKARLVAQGLSLLCLYFTALHMVVAPFPRYSVPLRPMLYALAGLGFVLLVRYSVSLYRAHAKAADGRIQEP